MNKRVISSVIASSYIVICCACSPGAYTSTESLMGAALGTAAGSGVGLLYANKYGNKTENILINGAIGSGVGLLAGALLHERNLKVAKERDVVLREARLIHENEKELVELRKQIESASSWGQNEPKPYDQRYPEANPNRPYQGPKKLFP